MSIFKYHRLLLLAAPLFLWSCEDDAEIVTAKETTPPTLSASSSAITLDADRATEEAVRFSWNQVSYGFEGQIVNYKLQFDLKGGNFSTPQEFSITSALEKSFTVADFNSVLLRLGLKAGNTGEIEARVVSGLTTLGTSRAAGVFDAVSEVVNLSATPYYVVVEYPSIYVPGSHQGWDPASAPKLASVKSDKRYEGYVNFPDASTEFKFTDGPSWDVNYGEGTAKGTLTAGGDNIKASSAGYYLIKADLEGLTFSLTKTTWGIIGDATPGGWDADTDMTYDAATQTWTITADLEAGEIKFRANDGWDLNYGDDGEDGLLEAGAANIKVSAAGKYTITLDLSNPGNYTYGLTKN